MAKPSTPWIVALVGCGCLVPIVAGVLLCGGAFVGVGAALKGSEPYRLGLEAARADAAVLAAFGGSIEPGTLVKGSINLDNNNGDAELSIPISGPAGSGSVEVKATKFAGAWTMDRIVVVKDSGERWDLTPPPLPPPTPAATP